MVLGCQNIAEVNAILATILAQAEQLPPPQLLVVVSDWRNCTVMAEDAAEQLVAGMRRSNGHFERAATLFPVSSSVATLQIGRLLRESHSSQRRGFKEPDALIAWLAEVLTVDETLRLRAFVHG
jgi:hypothetical protein